MSSLILLVNNNISKAVLVVSKAEVAVVVVARRHVLDVRRMRRPQRRALALGGVGAIVLAVIYRQFSFQMMWDSARDTVKVTAMVFAILIGATAFSMVFSYTGGDYLLEEWMMQLPGEKWGFLILSMLVILVLGFFIDFVEISFIIVPILAPVAEAMGINMLWFAILIAMNLQTSFLTPPFGFSLFYLKGVSPPEVKTTDIYKGVMPFILLQILVLVAIFIVPEWFGMSSTY